ncbi:MAG: response regulator [Armatimonadetes bacterium]|nr:response regulator [Armatimonadota bacterium]
MCVRILIVDDDDTIRALLTDVLSLLGHKTLCASSCAEALASMEALPPDLVLLDLKLLDGPGWILYEEMQSRFSLRSIPVIVLTGDIEALPAGALPESPLLAFLEKPFSVKALKAAIDEVVTNSRITAFRRECI